MGEPFGGCPFAFVCLLVLLSLLFDFLDGLIARILNVQSEIGKQLDSLADMVSFGVLPGFLLFIYLPNQIGINFDTVDEMFIQQNMFHAQKIKVVILGLVVALASAYRLAKFNIDKDQSFYFKGLATPAMTLFVVGLVALFNFIFIKDVHLHDSFIIDENIIKYSNFIISIISVFLSFLMVSNIPMFSFKIKTFGWKENWFRYLLILVSIPLLIWLNIGAFALIIPIYILLSLIARKSFT